MISKNVRAQAVSRDTCRTLNIERPAGRHAPPNSNRLRADAEREREFSHGPRLLNSLDQAGCFVSFLFHVKHKKTFSLAMSITS